MSFILDALKKSEAERQRQNAPGIASIPEQGQTKSSRKWIWLVVGLLVVNLSALGGLLLWKNVTVTETEVPIASTVENSAGATFSEIVSEVKRNQPVANGQTGSMPAVQGADTIPAGSGAAAEVAAPGRVDHGLESFNDLRAKGELQLPDMHLDIHVYSGAPADRFVFVNMSKYKENATLSEGPLVREITPEGVVLEHQNKVFLLPRE